MSYPDARPSSHTAVPCPALALSLLTLLLLCAAAPVGAAEGRPAAVAGELIVLLDTGPGVPTPEQVVDRQRQGVALGIDLGSPEAAEYALHHRARGALRARLAADPANPRARLERYLLLRYPPLVDTDAMMRVLDKNPRVRHVEPNLLFEFAVSPNDPFFPFDSDPTLYQWGIHALNLPAAWDRSKGHGYVGLNDTGLDTTHPDLRALDGVGNYLGGNYRPHLSWDFEEPSTCDEDGDGQVDDPDGCVDEQEEDPNAGAGHGTHVAGIVAANTDNGTGVAGACWNCSVLMTRGVRITAFSTTTAWSANGLTWLVDHGAQVVSMSYGAADLGCDPDSSGLSFFCTAIEHAEDRDVMMTASPGNDKTDIEFPASDPRVLSIGGIESTGAFWDRADEGDGCPCNWDNRPNWLVTLCNSTPTVECGSNYTVTPGSAQQDLVAPAKEVLSTFYRGASWNQFLGCWDDPSHAGTGYDVCTGTSMASPYAAGVAGLLRSVNPLLSKAQIRQSMIDHADGNGVWHPKFGYGVPDAAASADDVLGEAGGAVLDNRLTPLFQQFSSTAGDYAYTTVPQYASVLTWEPEDYISPLSAPRTGGYGPFFPGGRTCQIGPCLYEPRADVYVFTTDRSPNGHPLVPLYRLSFDDEFGGNPDDRDHNYTTEAAGIEVFAGVGYRLDGVEGYIYERCTPEPSCIPAGAVRLYRLYNATRDDWAIFPESKLASFQADGYTSQACCNDWIGYVYENVDSDFDTVIDGFETLIGTNPADSDSDCDGAADGTEILQYPYSDPLGAPGCSTSQVIGETGQLSSLTHTPQTVGFSRVYSNPVVLAQPASFDGSHVSVVRITSVTSTGFTFYVHEAPNHDGPHTTETVSWVVLEAGSWQLADGTELEAGTVVTNRTVGTRVSGGSFQTVSFAKPFSVAPVALSQVQTNDDPRWVKTRQQLAGTTSFRLALEEDEAATAYHGTETVGWLAITPAKGTWSGRPYQAAVSANVVTDAFTNLSFNAGFTAAPRFVAAMATRNGGNNAGLRYRNLGSASVQVKVEEDTTWDSEVAHISEQVSFLAIQGNGTLEGSPR